MNLDLRVAAESRFSSKSPPKFSTQVAAEFWDKSHDLLSKYNVNLQ